MSKSYLKKLAVSLREEGYSYELIRIKTGVSKSTLSLWLRNIYYIPNKEVQERMKRGQVKSSETLKRLKLERLDRIKVMAGHEIENISKRDLMFLGIGLYIGEGAKYKNGIINFSNSDPKVVNIMIRWFTNILGVQVRNLYIRLHLYPDNNSSKSLEFWSKSLGIPTEQFGKVYIDLRKNKSVKNIRKLPYGTVHVRIRALGNKKLGKTLFYRVLAWIEVVEDRILAGIV